MKNIFKDYYGSKLDDKTVESYKGVEYVAYDKEYDNEALENDQYDKKNDEIDFPGEIYLQGPPRFNLEHHIYKFKKRHISHRAFHERIKIMKNIK